MNSETQHDKEITAAGGTDAGASHGQEIRRLFRPALLALALAALVVVALAASLFWTTQQIRLTDDALMRRTNHPISLMTRAALLQRRAGFADAAPLILGVLVPVLLALLAFGGYRASADARRLNELFTRQIVVRQEQVEALRRRDLLLSAAVGAAGDAVIATDPAGRVTLLNPSAERLTAWDEADALGREVKTVLTLVDEQTGAALPDPAAALLADPPRLDFPANAVQVARTGERRAVTGSGTPFQNGSGEPGGVALAFRDVSERRDAAEALRCAEALRRASEACTEALLETAPDCIVLMRDGGAIVGFNPAAERVFGWTPRQALGRPAADLLFPASSREGFRQELHRSPSSNASSGASRAWVDIPALRSDGRTFPAEMTITRIARQEAPLSVIHLRDVSDRREAESALRQVQDAAREAALAESLEQSALLANMSDELRTPLNAVIGYSEMLQEEAHDCGQDDLVPDLQKIHGAGKHLLSLVNDILDLSKIESGQMELYPETFDVAALLREVTETIRPVTTRNDNTLQVRVADDIGATYADRVKVKQSLLNLLSNAAEFSHGRVMALEADREQDGAGEWITFRLADAGTDQGGSLQHQLLEAAPDLETSGRPRISGHGLALVLARRFCQMQGGEFSGSREPGHGAAYRLRFPAR